MNKRLVAKLAVMVAVLSAMTLLQGCSNEVNSTIIGNAWMPVNSASGSTTNTTATGGSTSGGGQAAAVQ